MDDAKQDELLQIGNILGQREMLHNIQKQAMANGGLVDIKLLANLSRVVQGYEQIYGIEDYGMDIDQGIRESSINLAKIALESN